MGAADIEAKARDLLGPVLGDRRADAVVEACARLTHLRHTTDLITLIAR